MGDILSRFTEGVNSTNNENRVRKKVTWNQKSFDEGRFRYAIMGTWEIPVAKRGDKCVIKHLKESHTWEPTDWATTLQVYKEASDLAEQFNKFHNKDRVVSFVEVDVLKCTEHRIDNIGGPQFNEYFVVEPYLPGAYTKWCNNYSYWNENDKHAALMQAFVHWSFYYTGGQRIVADLQGTVANSKYTLTDPVILSTKKGQYGSTDMGIEAMVMLLLKHTCNSICRHLPKPTLAMVKSKIPPQQLQVCMQMLNNLNNSTAYIWELRLPDPIERRLAEALKYVATGHY